MPKPTPTQPMTSGKKRSLRLEDADEYDPYNCVFEEDEELYENYGEYFEEYCPKEAEYWSEENDSDSYSDYSYFYQDNQPTEQVTYACDTCEKDFWSKDYFDKHMSEHITCKLDGCTFTAHEKIVEKHIRMQHSTGLYDKIKKLNTPEDIAKWIEDRKKNYPNKENIEKRYAQQIEKIRRGDRIPKNENRFGKDKFRWDKNQPSPNQKFNPKTSKKRKPKPPPKVSLIDVKANWNGNMFPFTGTSELFKEEEDIIKSDFEDDEWQENAQSNEKKKQPVIKLNNALGALMGAYGSDSEEDDDYPTEVPIIKIEKPAENPNVPTEKQTEVENLIKTAECDVKVAKEKDVKSDDEPPEEIKIEKSPPEVEVNSNLPVEVPTASENKPNKTNRQRQRKRKHSIKKEKSRKLPRNNSADVSSSQRRPPNAQGFANTNRFRRRKVSLLEKLLASEIRDERNFLLQCVRYTVQNNFLTNDGS